MLLERDEVGVVVEGPLVAGQHAVVAGTDELGFDRPHHLDTAAVHGELEAVAEDHRLLRPLLVLTPDHDVVEEVVVTGERDRPAVDPRADHRVELGLAGA